jgi:hypothetical protein
MDYIVRMKNYKQYARASRVLSEMPGTWQSGGDPEAPTLRVQDIHLEALAIWRSCF